MKINMTENTYITDIESNMRIQNISRMNSFTATELLLHLALILNLLYSLFYPVYSSLHSFYHLIILVFIMMMIMMERCLKLSLNELFAIACFFGTTILAIYLNHSGFGLVINILWPLTIIYIYKNSNLTPSYLNRINVLMFFGWLVAMLATFVYNDQFFVDLNAGIVIEAINPNTMAIVIVFTSLFLQLYIESRSQSKTIKTMISILSFFAIYRTRSRTTLVAFVAILIMEFFGIKKIKKSKALGILVPVLIIIAGVVFPFVYTMLFTKGIVSYHTLFLGKRIFTGRQYIWQSLWEYLLQHKEAFLWGVGYNTELYSRGTFNMHNAYLSVFAQYGIPLFFCWMWYILRSIAKMYNNYGKISNLQFKCYQILVYVLIIGFGEGVLTYLPNMIFIAMAIGIGNREKREVL